MNKILQQKSHKGEHRISICGSKSESNRLLIIQALYNKLNIQNLSTSDDTQVLKAALSSDKDLIDIHHAGTAMRFLTAYYACFTTKTVTLTGSERMQQRPIKILVDGLLQLGAKIEYINNEGYPPLKIYPTKLKQNKLNIRADTSSQYISALMLVAPKLKEGLQINFTSKITSLPYLKMTQKLMQNLGFEINFDSKSINIKPKNHFETQTIKVESDWSSASYYYSLVALSSDLKLNLSTFKNDSLQGDSKLVDLYSSLGVKTTFKGDSILLENSNKTPLGVYTQNLNHTPDLAQTIAVTCLGLGISCQLSGLHTLKIKETDRLVALKNEMEKFGASVQIDNDHLHMTPPKTLNSNPTVNTYNDHRMAMAFAPLKTKTNLIIRDPEVVGKSYPEFWKDFENI
ncbi:MAG: 3-phosphoshikimate 1-carboxyvinyltransferase [Bacteroidetes bacterium]|jgi:3-phosphoshikimate 1-carboxyvinyltransferase|nr:3-phosphoshikimate 1-carboxyvinyltransferase [Bacteroidota bacterium]